MFSAPAKLQTVCQRCIEGGERDYNKNKWNIAPTSKRLMCMGWPNSSLQWAMEMILRWPEPMSIDLDIKSEAALIHTVPTADSLCDFFFFSYSDLHSLLRLTWHPEGLLSIYLLRCDQDLSLSSTSLATSGIFQPVQFYLCEHEFFLIRPKATKWVLYSS